MDAGHVKREIAFKLGQHIGEIIENNRMIPNETYIDDTTESYIQVLSSTDDPVSGPPELRLPMTTNLKFVSKHNGIIRGLMIESRNLRFLVSIKGQKRLVWTYWDPENQNPPAVVRFISIPSIPVKKGEEIVILATPEQNAVNNNIMGIHSVLITNK